MLTAAAFVPGAPLVVPAVSGPGATDVIELRTSALTVVGRLAETAQRWIAVGVGDAAHAEPSTGTFAGFGVDERVSLLPVGPDPVDPAVVSPMMATPLLVAGWLRGQAAPRVTVCPTLIAASATSQECAALGSALGARIIESDSAIGVLVIADGSFGLSAGAPGGAIDGAADVQERIDAAVAAGDLEALAGLDPQVCADLGIAGRAAWQVASAIWRTAGVQRPSAESLYCAAPFGVGYQVAWWSR